MVPASAGTRPNSTFISVVLPEPFSPSRPTIRPAGIETSMPRFARTAPNDFSIPRISSMARETKTGSGAAARVFFRGLHGERAGRELLLEALDLGDHRGRHGGVERPLVVVEQ